MHSVETIHNAERMGINATLQSIDFGRLRDFRVSTVETMTKGLTGLWHRGVTVFAVARHCRTRIQYVSRRLRGDAGIAGPWKPACSKPVETELAIDADDVVLATGSRPLALPGNPFAGALIDSTQALELNTLPPAR